MEQKFSVLEVARLRNDLLHRGLDSFEVADVIKMFLAERGHGASAEMARDVATEFEGIGYTVSVSASGWRLWRWSFDVMLIERAFTVGGGVQWRVGNRVDTLRLGER